MENKDNFNSDEMMKMSTAIYNKHFSGCDRFKEDLISEGVLGILNAIEKYKKEQGFKLSTYAWNTARGWMMEYLKKERKKELNLGSLSDYEWVADDRQSFNEFLYMRDDLEKIRKIVSRFRTRDRFIAEKMIEGYNRAEIARLLDSTTQSVWLTWERLRNRIIREFNGKGKTEGVNGR